MQQCGPTLMLSMAGALLAALALLGLFAHRNNVSSPHARTSSAVSNLPKQ